MSTTNDPTQYLQLVRECGHTVIISNGAGATGPIGVLLPVGAEIGDVVEIYAEVVNVLAAPAIGESFADFTPTPSSEEGGWNSVSVPPTAGVKFRKTSSSNWKVMV